MKNIAQLLSITLLALIIPISAIGSGGSRIKILVDDFQQKGIKKVTKKSTEIERLGQILPFFLSNQLREENYEVIFLIDEFKPEPERNLQLLDSAEILKKKINYRIIGSYSVSAYGSVEIDLRLIQYNQSGNRSSISNFNIRTATMGDVSGVFYGVVQDVDAKIKQHQTKGAEKRNIGILCYSQSNYQFEIDTAFGSDIAAAIYYKLRDIKEKNIDWKAPGVNCNNPSITNTRNLSAFITGQVDYLDSLGRVSIGSKLVIKELEDTIALPLVYGNIGSYYDLEDKVIEQLNSLMATVIDTAGGWDMELLDLEKMQDYDALVQNAETYFNDLKYGKSELLLNKAIRLQYNSEEALVLLTKIKLEQELIDQAEKLCDIILDNNPNSTWALFTKGKLADNEGDYKRALELYKKVSTIDPDNPVIHFFIGLAYFDLDSLQQAIKELEIQVKKDTLRFRSTVVLSTSSFLLAQKDDTPNARSLEKKSFEILKGSLELNQSDDAKYIVGTIFASMGFDKSEDGNYQDALTYFEAANQIAPSEENYDNIRYTLNALGDFEKLDSLIIKGIESGIWTDKIYINSAEDLRGIKEEGSDFYSKPSLEHALNHLAKYIRNHPNDVVALRLTGAVNFRLKKYPQAKRFYHKALKEDDDSNEALWTLLDIAEIEIVLEEPDQALKDLKKITPNLLEKGGDEKDIIRTLKIYLTIMARIMLDQETKDQEETLNSMLKEVYIAGWNYSTLRGWMKTSPNLSERVKNELVRITDLMQANSFSFD